MNPLKPLNPLQPLRPIETAKGTLPALIYTMLSRGQRSIDDVTLCVDEETKDNVSNTMRMWQEVLNSSELPVLLKAPAIDGDDDDPLRRANEPEATFVYGSYVYKWFEDRNRAFMRHARAVTHLRDYVPYHERHVGQWLSYAYAPGFTLAEIVDWADGPSTLKWALDWFNENLWINEEPGDKWAIPFYRDKTLRRLRDLPSRVRVEQEVINAIESLPWAAIADECRVTPMWHGDCSFENLVLSSKDRLVLLDWREDLRGDHYWDLAKLLKSAHFDHRKIDTTGELRGHDREDELEHIIVDWCKEHGRSLKKLWLVYTLHWFAMSGRYAGALGDKLYERGKLELVKYLQM